MGEGPPIYLHFSCMAADAINPETTLDLLRRVEAVPHGRTDGFATEWKILIGGPYHLGNDDYFEGVSRLNMNETLDTNFSVREQA